jgi:hypothetical protein
VTFRNPLTYIILLGAYLLGHHPWAFIAMMAIIALAWEFTMNKGA